MKEVKLWMLAAILICGFVLTSCSNNDGPIVPVDEVEAQLQQMTLREKVGQLFYIRLESLDPSIEWTTYDDLASIKILEDPSGTRTERPSATLHRRGRRPRVTHCQQYEFQCQKV